MSLILDALNKADNERKKQQEMAPGIATPHEGILASKGNNPFNKIWLLVGAGALLLLLLVVYLLGRSSSTAETATPPQLKSSQKPSQAKSATVAAKTNTPSHSPTAKRQVAQQGAKTPTPNGSNTTNKATQAPQTKQLIAQQYAKAAAAKQGKTPTGSNSIGQLYQNSAQTEASNTAENNEVAAEPSYPKAAKDTLDYFTDIAGVRELTYSMQQKIPTLMYQDHQYTKGGRSTITINGKTVRKGGRAAQGVTVENILADGIILKFQNEKFKMPAYSSWVNM